MTTAPLDIGKASEASTKLRIVHISILALQAQAHQINVRGPLRYEVAHRPATWSKLGNDALICLFAIDTVIELSDTGTKAAEISVTLRSEYRLEESFEVGKDEHLLPHYVGIVARLHAWPYFRAEVQTLSTKIGIPPLTLPVLLAGHTVRLPVEQYLEEPVPESANRGERPTKKRSVKARRAKAAR